MTKIELLDYLTKMAKRYCADGVDSIARNSHMLGNNGDQVKAEHIPVVLTDFINSIGMHQGVDYALYVEDLNRL